MLAVFRVAVRHMERPERIARIEPLLRQPGGATISRVVEVLRERRDIISNDLEAMRDEMGLPVHWDPDTGTYRLGESPAAGQPCAEGVDLALLYRAIALEEYLYVTVTTVSGTQKRIHALPGKVKKVRGRRQVKLQERSGAWRVVDLEAINGVAEAFGINKQEDATPNLETERGLIHHLHRKRIGADLIRIARPPCRQSR